MASRTFLNSEELRQARKKVVNVNHKIGEDSAVDELSSCGDFSQWLSTVLLKKLASISGWSEVRPVALGSWSRNELSPKSDIDLLFCGKEAAVRQYVERATEAGLLLSYRMPLNRKDWSEGIETKDLISLLEARPLEIEGKTCLREELSRQQGLLTQKKEFKRTLIRHLSQERSARHSRYDSISNFLEPNIKYGPGGLRDLHQSLFLTTFFVDKLKGRESEVKTLRYSFNFLLFLRQHMHLHGLGDVLVASEQQSLAKVFGYSELSIFMRDLQLELSRARFLTDWSFEMAKSGEQKRLAISEFEFSRNSDFIRALQEVPSVMMQQRVLQKSQGWKKRLKPSIENGKILKKALSPYQSVEFFEALFCSNLLEKMIPELFRVKGYVQHDQYHKYTVKAHTLMAVKKTVEFFDKPSKLGDLKGLTKSMTLQDWRILLWTAVYHDLCKGKDGDHSTLEARLVRRDMAKMGMSKTFTEEVSWLVENHLILSTAAFRRNPKDPATWTFLSERGVRGKRLIRLALFTVIDICATNPEAWTEWKASLLDELVDAVLSPQATRVVELMNRAKRQKLKMSQGFIAGIESRVLEEVPLKLLVADYAKLQSIKGELKPLLSTCKPYFWVRFHQPIDQKGVLLKQIERLFACGCAVREASIKTFDRYGVYNWFKVRSRMPKPALAKLLMQPLHVESPFIDVKFDQIQIVSEVGDEAVLSFKGKDQKGALVTAVKALTSRGMVIRWAKVHTWGRQLEDIFAVEKSVDFLQQVKSLRDSCLKK